MVTRNNDLRMRIFGLYNDLLHEECGLDYDEAIRVFGEIGNATGSYPDTLLLFAKMIKHYKLKNIVEFGSGMSTLFLAKIAKDLNISFVSYEEKKRYLNMTTKLIESFHLKPNIKMFYHNEPIDVHDKDFVFIDCSGDLRKELSTYISGFHIRNCFIVIDDINDYPSLVSYFKDPYCFYNGTGRLDRYQFIKYHPETNFPNFLTQEMNYL